MYAEIYEQSGVELIRGLGKRFREYRKRMGLKQKQVSEKTGLSVLTISTFEKGDGIGITMGSFIKMLRAIEFLEEIDKLLPELPESPRALYYKQHGKSVQRK